MSDGDVQEGRSEEGVEKTKRGEGGKTKVEGAQQKKCACVSVDLKSLTWKDFHMATHSQRPWVCVFTCLCAGVWDTRSEREQSSTCRFLLCTHRRTCDLSPPPSRSLSLNVHTSAKHP